MSTDNKEFGFTGEQHAATYLLSKGYELIEQNASSRWGEIDLIMKKGDRIVFVEVKSRRDDRKGKPYEAVTYGKLKHLARSMKYYILMNKLEKSKFQLDVVGIILSYSGSVIDLRHYENVAAPL